ncbi:MAG: phage tail assembly chaperone [Rhizobiales bacterium]|nr:phage tail assembly chaperone [Hyphomicrobiales bacterium]
MLSPTEQKVSGVPMDRARLEELARRFPD